MADRTCDTCGKALPPQTSGRPRLTCSDRCRMLRNKRLPSFPDNKRRSDAKYREKLKAERAAARSARARDCDRCGARFEPNRSVNQRFCTVECRRLFWERTVEIPTLSCDECGSSFQPAKTWATRSPRFCSPRCNQRNAMRRRRARLIDAFVAEVNASEVFERDGWTCQLCGAPVDRSLRHPDLMAASLDHIVPLARGGTHEPSNCQLAHYLCNCTKGDERAIHGLLTT